MVFNLDLSAVPGDITPGQYVATITEAKLAFAQETGNAFIKMRFDIAEGEHAGQVTFKNVMLQPPKALFTLKQFLTGLGFQNIPDNLEVRFDGDTEDANLISPDIVGMGCKVYMSNRKGQNGYPDRVEITRIIEGYGHVPALAEDVTPQDEEIADAPWEMAGDDGDADLGQPFEGDDPDPDLPHDIPRDVQIDDVPEEEDAEFGDGPEEAYDSEKSGKNARRRRKVE